jgi:ribose transport system substrate-binding protein
MRILAGEGPKLNIIMVPVPKVTQADLPKMYEKCMTPNSVSAFPVVPKDPLPTPLMNAYFRKPGEVGPFDYKKTPRAC